MCTVYLAREHKFYWLTLLPAIFMTMVVSDFFLVSPTILGLDQTLGLILSACFTVVCIVCFALSQRNKK